MILDLILKENTYFLKIHKNFFQNKSAPVALFKIDSPLMEKYSYLGEFHIGGAMFGFGGCFKIQGEENDYIIYKFNFPEKDNDIAMRKMLLTVYLATYYVVEQMFYEKEFFSEAVWDDQALSFVIFDGGYQMGGYSIGGQLYPWFKKRLYSLSDEDLVTLNSYVISELKRVYNYFFKEELSYDQITISRESFFIQVNMSGRWLSWTKNRDADKSERFDLHNIDFHSDQELCFAAIIGINTWLREN
ncbi:MAG: hypothetical protein WC863_02630 [Patescibacteria group bacterium]